MGVTKFALGGVAGINYKRFGEGNVCFIDVHANYRRDNRKISVINIGTSKIMMIIFNLCFCGLLVFYAIRSQHRATVRMVCVFMLIAQGWLCLGYRAAHREVTRSKYSEQAMSNARNQQEAIEWAWNFGCSDAIGYTLTTYIPTFAIYSIAFAILAMTPLRSLDLAVKKRVDDA